MHLGRALLDSGVLRGGGLGGLKGRAMRFVFVFESKRIEPGTTNCKDTWSVSRSNSTGRSSAGGDANLVIVIGLNVF